MNAYSNTDADPGVWTHIAASFDDSANQVRLYLNGRLVTESTETRDMESNTVDLFIGNNNTRCCDGPIYYRGSIDDIRIYNRILGAAEIADLYSEQ